MKFPERFILANSDQITNLNSMKTSTLIHFHYNKVFIANAEFNRHGFKNRQIHQLLKLGKFHGLQY
jgi:predicted nucleic acid-binding protein